MTTWADFKAAVEAAGVCDTDILLDVQFWPHVLEQEQEVAISRCLDETSSPPCVRTIIYHRLPASAWPPVCQTSTPTSLST